MMKFFKIAWLLHSSVFALNDLINLDDIKGIELDFEIPPLSESRKLNHSRIKIFEDDGVMKYEILKDHREFLKTYLKGIIEEFKKEGSKRLNELTKLSSSPPNAQKVLNVFSEKYDDSDFLEAKKKHQAKLREKYADLVRFLILNTVSQNAIKNIDNPSPKFVKDYYWEYDTEMKASILYLNKIRDITLPSEVFEFQKSILDLDFLTLSAFYDDIKNKKESESVIRD